MPKVTRKIILGALAVVFTLTIALAQRLPRGTATILSSADLLATAKKSADKPVNDTQVAVVDVNNGEYHLAIGIAHRSKESVSTPGGGGVEHTDITEVYHIISGNATLSDRRHNR